MATTFVEVSAYRVFSYGGPTGNGGADAVISLAIPRTSAYLRFYPEGTPLPPNAVGTNVLTGIPMFYVSYRYAQFENVVDLLRNEGPIRFYFNDANLIGYVTTASEPVGEGEA